MKCSEEQFKTDLRSDTRTDGPTNLSAREGGRFAPKTVNITGATAAVRQAEGLQPLAQVRSQVNHVLYKP